MVDLSSLVFESLGDVVDLVQGLVLLFHLLLVIGLHAFLIIIMNPQT
jgi:hypothetical protein